MAHLVQRIDDLYCRHAALLKQQQQCSIEPSLCADSTSNDACNGAFSGVSVLPEASRSVAAACCAAVEQSLVAAAAHMRNADEAARALRLLEAEVDPHADNAQRFDKLVRASDMCYQ